MVGEAVCVSVCLAGWLVGWLIGWLIGECREKKGTKHFFWGGERKEGELFWGAAAAVGGGGAGVGWLDYVCCCA